MKLYSVTLRIMINHFGFSESSSSRLLSCSYLLQCSFTSSNLQPLDSCHLCKLIVSVSGVSVGETIGVKLSVHLSHSRLVHLRPRLRSPGHHPLQRQPDGDVQQLRRQGGAGQLRFLPRRSLLGNDHRPLRQPPGPGLRDRPGWRPEGRDAGEGRQGLGHVRGQQPLLVHAQQLAHQQVRIKVMLKWSVMSGTDADIHVVYQCVKPTVFSIVHYCIFF